MNLMSNDCSQDDAAVMSDIVARARAALATLPMSNVGQSCSPQCTEEQSPR